MRRLPSRKTASSGRKSTVANVVAASGAIMVALLGTIPAGAASHLYGGVDAGHDCGALRYVRIEFAGSSIAARDAVPGLTVAGCGSATEIDLVQVHRSAGDGVGMRGGNADLRHVVATQAGDDGLDWSEGWTGRTQFLIAQQAADAGIEGTNNAADPAAVPRSQPRLYNVTLVGRGAVDAVGQLGAVFQDGSGVELRNAILIEHSALSIDIVGAESASLFEGEIAGVRNSTFFKNGAPPGYDDWPLGFDADGFDEQAAFTDFATANNGLDPLLLAPLSASSPDFTPQPGSPVATAAATPPEDGFFDASAAFRGVIGPGGIDWAVAWTAYPTSQTPADSSSVVTLTGAGSPPVLEITTETSWSGTVLLADGVRVHVGNGATLTLAPGTIVKGSPGSAIFVERSGRIDATGSAAVPIVFTSDQPSGSAAAGDWAGLFLLGRAPINAAGGEADVLVAVPEPPTPLAAGAALGCLVALCRGGRSARAMRAGPRWSA